MTAKILRKTVVTPQYGIGVICLYEKEKDALTGEMRYTYGGMEQVYKAHKSDFDFNPGLFISMDGRTANRMREIDYKKLQGIFEKGASHYSEDAAIRKNIAMVRMWLYNLYFPDGDFDYKKAEHRYAQQYLNDIGFHIAEMYEGERLARAPRNLATSGKGEQFAERRFGDLGLEHVGAREIYRRLLMIQNRPTFNPLRWFKGKFHNKDWKLPPLEESPFRERDIEEALTNDRNLQEAGVANARSALVADALWTFEVNYNLAHATARPEGLPDHEAERAVLLAKHIIEELKKLKFGSSDHEMDSIEMRDKNLQEAQKEAQLCMTYQKIILDLAAHDPYALQSDPHFLAAQEAIGKLGYLTVQKAKEEAYRVDDADLAHKLMKEERNIPEAYKMVDSRDESALIQQIEIAIRAAVRYRDQKTRSPVLKHAGVALNPELAKAVLQDGMNMRSRIDNTSAYIAGVSTTRANWAIHAAEAINREKSVQLEQKEMHSAAKAPAAQEEKRSIPQNHADRHLQEQQQKGTKPHLQSV